MTTADFIAGSFWPLTILFALALKLLWESPVWRFVLAWAVGTALVYLGLFIVYGLVSIMVVIDQFVGLALLGFAVFNFAATRWMFAEDSKERWKMAATTIFGIGMVAFGGMVLFRDFVLSREVIEGRVEKVYEGGSRLRHYNVKIAGKTVKAIIPDYERLALLPVVRVEVGRGSEYIYRIEYLAN